MSAAPQRKDPLTGTSYSHDSDVLYVAGREASLTVTDKGPTRVWLAPCGDRKAEERVFFGRGAYAATGRHLKDGVAPDPYDSAKRVRYYARIVPDSYRPALHELDCAIADLEAQLQAKRAERQEYLAACAKAGKPVPMPSKAENAKPTRKVIP